IPFFEKAALSVVPLRFGAGIKLKVLETLTAKIPTLATDVGAEVSVRLLAEGLVNLGDQVTVLSLNNKGSKEDAIYSGVLNS
ncbi:glycosyltransferase, partial [Klebsiella pneumoniae]